MSDSEKSTAAVETKSAAVKTGSSTKPSFWKGTKAEFRKIIWPDRPTLTKQTAAVVVVSIIMGAIIAVIDRAVLYGIDAILK